jgi:hypothetical protein
LENEYRLPILFQNFAAKTEGETARNILEKTSRKPFAAATQL